MPVTTKGNVPGRLFNDMSAVCYESYTDFGDWPMSSGFTVDWARGNTGKKPVWLTTNWGSSSEGNAKSLFHAFARGLAGGGMPMQADLDPVELTRRGTAMNFIAQYGALSRDATPEGRVAILSRTARQALVPRGMWQLHVLYCHLTRLGFPPVLVADEDVAAGGVPTSVKALVLVDEQVPLEPEVRTAIDKFIASGGKVITAGKSAAEFTGSIAVDVPVKHLWELKGFEAGSHAELWKEFDAQWRGPLAAALGKAGLEPLATTDIDGAIALSMNAGPVRYVVVIADANGTNPSEFQRPINLPLSLEGTGWIVRDLVKQQQLATKNEGGRTVTSVDLATEPATLLAVHPEMPAKIEVKLAASPRLGAAFAFSSQVRGAGGAKGGDLGSVPLAYTLRGPDGKERAHWYGAAHTEESTRLAAHDQPGNWQLEVQELLTGLTATAEISVTAGNGSGTAKQVGDVHVCDEHHVAGFLARQDEKLVIVEPGQGDLLPVAEQLVSSLAGAGVKARLWKVRPEDFDTEPMRWFPRPEDEARMREIQAGRLIGYRANLKAHIDKLKRVHVPELGGYHEIDPPYMVGRDCIVFSGGRLAESLRAVTPWMGGPHSPGVGQGRLVVCFSPFMADRQALALVANDAGGTARTAEFLATAARSAGKTSARRRRARRKLPRSLRNWSIASSRPPIATIPLSSACKPCWPRAAARQRSSSTGRTTTWRWWTSAARSPRARWKA